MAALLVVGLCVPDAFDDAALIFAVAYAFVRVAHIALFMLASRDDALFRTSVVGLAISTAIGVGLLVAASFADGWLQGGLWAAALALDMGGPYFFGAEGWKLAPHHFSERHGLIVIIALGESIVAARRLASAEPGRHQNEMARDSYSYVHFPMVAGIVLVAHDQHAAARARRPARRVRAGRGRDPGARDDHRPRGRADDPHRGRDAQLRR